MEDDLVGRAPRAGGGGDGWAELHCHSAFSLRDGATLPGDLARCAAALDYPALALTDHHSLAGIVAHARACQAAGLRPIAGLEVALDDGSHLTLLARDATGYRSLAQLATQAHLAVPDGEPYLTWEALTASSAGLECLTGCRQGRVARALLRDDVAGAAQELGRLRELVGAAHIWLEAQCAGLPDDAKLLHGLAALARRGRAPLVATGNAHYAEPGDRALQDVLVAIRHRLPLARARRHLRPGASWHLRSPAEVARRFAPWPVALRGARALAERCGFALAHIDAALPRFPVPEGDTAMDYLERLARAGAADRYGDAAASVVVQARLAHELGVIAGLRLADYFLIVWDIVREAGARGILLQGRGSAVGSLCCYSLGITSVEPLAHGLSFERFLSPSRTDPPDIDLDLPADRPGRPAGREALIQYVLRRYAGHAALICNIVTFQARSSIRDVGLALGLAPTQIDALASEPDLLLEAASGQDAPHRAVLHGAASLDLPSGPILSRLRALCRRLEGLPRHLSQHPGGMALTARPLAQVVPVQRPAMEGRLIAQVDKDAAEGAGLVKIDLLGLGIMTVIDRCFDLIAAESGERPHLHGVRCDDPAVYDMLCASDTVGVFTFESRAQMTACLPRLQPRCYADLIVAAALIRPGPLHGNATHPYLRRRQGLEPIRYPGGAAGRRLLEPILAETLGVILFQDQVISVGVASGLSPDEAAELRRAMSSARGSARMAALRGRLEEGLAAQGLDAAGRAEVLDAVTAFAGYGLIKGHAASLAYLGYVSCQLKQRHPAAFLAALLDAQPLGFYPPEALVQDAARHGVRVLPVDVRHSRADCTLEGGAVRLGLRLVRGLGREACRRLEEAVRPMPPTLDLLCERAWLEEDEAYALAKSGALRGYIPERRRALWEARLAARAARERWLPALRALVDPPATLPPLTPLEEIALDRAALGLSPGHHVLEALRPDLAHRPLYRSHELAALPPGRRVELVGQVLSWQRPPTAHGVTFLGLSDETGLINLVVLPDVYLRDRALVHGEVLIWVDGVVERRGGSTAVQADRIRPLSALLTSGARP